MNVWVSWAIWRSRTRSCAWLCALPHTTFLREVCPLEPSCRNSRSMSKNSAKKKYVSFLLLKVFWTLMSFCPGYFCYFSSVFVGEQGEGILWAQGGHQDFNGRDGTWTREQSGTGVHMPRHWHFSAHTWQYQSLETAAQPGDTLYIFYFKKVVSVLKM